MKTLIHITLYILMVHFVILCFQKIEAFEHRLYSHPLTKDPKLEEWFGMYEQKAKVGFNF